MASVTDRPPEASDWQLLARLWPHLRQARHELVLSLVLLVPLSVANAIQPLLVQRAIDGPIRSGDLVGLRGLCLLLLLAIVLRMALQAWQGYIVQKVGQSVTAEIRADLFRHVTHLSASFFDRTPVGKLIARLTSDVEALGDVFATGAVGIFSDLAAIAVTALFMFSLRRDLSLLLVASVFPVTLAIAYFQYEYRRANYKARERFAELNAILQENIIGIGVVQLFRREALNAQRHERVNRQYIEEVNKTIFHDSAVSATLEWVSLVAIAGVLWVGGQQIANRALTFGELSAFVLYSQRLFEPLRQLAEKFTTIQSGFTAIERIQGLLSEPIDVRDPAVPAQLPPHGRGEIRFEGVWLAYKPAEFALRDVTFAIAPGERIALVGPTGAGKSSIIRLLSRLYDPTRGSIRIDGTDIRNLSQADLRRRVGVLLQDAFLFSGDVLSNITLGEPYTLEDCIAAAKLVGVHDFITALPDGYRTPIRERGTNLSGGQKQLLAFARVAIRDPRILVLDEATSSLDAATEYLVQQSLDRLMVGRTVIIIAHRLSSIRTVDRIMVMKQGELVESGTHDELLARDGLYAHLYELEMMARVG